MTQKHEYWVFGYGSLMWRPGFEHVASEPALIRGYHRRLCVYSYVHRGTPDSPGLVLGLDRGGSCHGMAYRVDAIRWPATLAYLREREQVTSVYLEARKTVQLRQSQRRVEAIAFLVDRGHRQYAGRLDTARLLDLLRRGEGISGRSADYLFSTLSHLRAMNIHDASLEHVAKELAA